MKTRQLIKGNKYSIKKIHPEHTVVFGVLIVSSLLNFSFTLTKLNIAHRHYMDGQVALGASDVIRVSELGDLIEYCITKASRERFSAY